MATISDIRVRPSGIYATVNRGGDVSTVILNHKLPRWDYLDNGSYIAISVDEWERVKAMSDNPIYVTRGCEMSTKGEMNREQAVAMVGEVAVSKVDGKNCEPTNRVGYNGECQGDDLCEWSASVVCQDKDGLDCVLTAYYYTTNEQDQIMAENSGDGSYIDWDIAGYDVV